MVRRYAFRYLMWVGVTWVAMAVAVFLWHGVLLFAFLLSFGDGPRPDNYHLFVSGIGMVLAGGIVGLTLGLAQAALLDGWTRRFGRTTGNGFGLWLCLTVVAFVFAGLVFFGLLLSEFESPNWGSSAKLALQFAIPGLSLGVWQWLFLRRRIQRSAWWIPASAISWGVGGLDAIAVGQIFSLWNHPTFLFGILNAPLQAGLALALALQGIPAMLLVRQFEQDADASGESPIAGTINPELA